MNELTLYLLVGAPGSGKTTHGKSLAKFDPLIERVCPDEFRAVFGWGEGDQSVSAQAFSATKTAAIKALTEGHSVIIDATNMYRKSRRDFINIARLHNAEVHAIVFEVDKNTLLSRNKSRGEAGGRNVPEDVIDRMLARYERPDTNEVDKVTFVCKIEP